MTTLTENLPAVREKARESWARGLDAIADLVINHPETWTRGALYRDENGEEFVIVPGRPHPGPAATCAVGFIELVYDDVVPGRLHPAAAALARNPPVGEEWEDLDEMNDALETPTEFVKWLRRAACGR